VTDVEQLLTHRIEQRIARRDNLHRLVDGDRALLPDHDLSVLARLTELGSGPDLVASQRERAREVFRRVVNG
jgi:hypothetical protein